MPRTLQRLNSLVLSRAKKPGYLADGGGLYLQVTPAGARSWIYRFALAGRRREMGLGPFPDVSLAAARKAASEARSLVKAGQDPIEARDAERARQRLEEARGVTFDQAAKQFLDTHESTWRNAKHRQQWRNTLDTYASPRMGTLSIAAIGIAEVTTILEPLWKTKPETASRVRGRIERVLDWAKVRGYRDGENPARWRGHLDKILPSHTKVRRVKHFEAVPIDDVATVYARLCRSGGMAALALRFAIRTAARSGEATGALWADIDLNGRVWTVPADRMKAGREHRVPLCREAMSILAKVGEAKICDFVFAGWVAGKPLSSVALSKALKAAGGGSATVHGFRSTFRDWAAERTNFSRDAAEMALAHSIGDKVEAAYRRGDLMEKRAAMMEAWATFATTPHKDGTIVALSRAAA